MYSCLVLGSSLSCLSVAHIGFRDRNDWRKPSRGPRVPSAHRRLFKSSLLLQTMLSYKCLSGAAQNSLKRSQVCTWDGNGCALADYQVRPSEDTQQPAQPPLSLDRRVAMYSHSRLASESSADRFSGQIYRYTYSRRW